jgi:serine protease
MLRPSLLKAVLPAVVTAVYLWLTLVAAGWDGLWMSFVQRAAAEARPPAYVSGQLSVAFEEGAEMQALAAISALPGASVKRVWPTGKHATVSVPVGREEEFKVRLAREPGVRYVELSYLRQPAEAPNDEFYERQWHLPLIQADWAWEISRGEGSIVAVLDTGVAFEDFLVFAKAPDLRATEFIHPFNATFGGYHPNDDDGHGTHVTGTIAQNTNNGEGVAGVAPAVSVIPVKVCIFIGCPSDAIANGVFWAVNHGADVINLSLGGPEISQLELDAFLYAEENGVVVVAAAGNGGSDGIGDPFLDFPAALHTVISVGAVRYDMTRAGYSNFPGQLDVGLHVMAPGGDLNMDQNNDGFADGVLQETYAFTCSSAPFSYEVFDYCYYEGTSMATPHVTGTVALIRSVFPDTTPAQVRELLACSALDLGPTGPDGEYGVGLVQAYDALLDEDEDGIPDCLDAEILLGARVSIGSATVVPGQTAVVAVTGHADPPGLVEYTIDIEFHEQALRPIACEPHPTAECEIDHAPGVVRISGTADDPLVGPFTLAQLAFEPLSLPGSLTELTPQVLVFTDAAMTDLVPEAIVKTGSVSIVRPVASGDADCNDVVDVVDSLWVLRDVAGMGSSECLDYADVNCDGAREAVDALLILRHVAGLSLSLPPGCPAIGSFG